MRILLLFLALAACDGGTPEVPAPHQIRIVGASAGLPFAADAAERYTLSRPDSIAPLAQADGSANGIARLCHGKGTQAADLVVATRPMTVAERGDCAARGTSRVVEIPFGWTAPVFVTGTGSSPSSLTTTQAIAAMTTAAPRWSGVDPALPDVPIALHGPAAALLAGDGTLSIGGRAIRRDGRYHAFGADAELVATTVAATPGVVGLLPYGYAARSGLRSLPLDGVAPTASAIADGRYRQRLPLLLLIRQADVGKVAGLRALLGLFAASLGPSGRFSRLGLVPLDVAGRDATRRAFDALGIAA